MTMLGLGLVRLGFQAASHRANARFMATELSASGKAHATLTECLACLENIKAAGAEQAFVSRWAEGQITSLNAGRKRHLFQVRQDVLMAFLTTLGQVAVFLLAGREVLEQRMTVGTFSAFLMLQGLFLTPLGAFLESLLHLQYLGSHLARLDDVLETQPEATGTVDPGSLAGNIRLEKVSFSYPGIAGQGVGPISLEVQEGEKIALVGPVGAGKSTLARLLLGMHVPKEGTIRFDGMDIRELDLARLRRQMGIVLQETFLLNDTVRANLTINREGIPLSRLREVTEVACIRKDIEALPLGFETPIGENGASLSGGQRQRLSLARALAHGPSILLLDEATSSLDLETESQVHRNLAALGCTRILIAHRLATVRDADRILVLEQGKIVQEGNFEALLLEVGLFRRMLATSEVPLG
jgi:ABC-type bacteriocin/lantibiotic exporter with double-glycine peptidase domain